MLSGSRTEAHACQVPGRPTLRCSPEARVSSLTSCLHQRLRAQVVDALHAKIQADATEAERRARLRRQLEIRSITAKQKKVLGRRRACNPDAT